MKILFNILNSAVKIREIEILECNLYYQSYATSFLTFKEQCCQGGIYISVYDTYIKIQVQINHILIFCYKVEKEIK